VRTTIRASLLPCHASVPRRLPSFALLTGAFSLGCALFASTRIVPTGPDSYIAEKQGMAARPPLSGAVADASDYCAKLGKRILVQSTNEGQIEPGTAPRAVVTFLCLDPNDPSYQRPQLQPVPDVRIEEHKN